MGQKKQRIGALDHGAVFQDDNGQVWTRTGNTAKDQVGCLPLGGSEHGLTWLSRFDQVSEVDVPGLLKRVAELERENCETLNSPNQYLDYQD